MTAAPTATWSYPTAIRFGPGRIRELAEACAEAGIQRPLMVTDRGLAGAPITETALDVLTGAGLSPGLFAQVDPNPTEENLERGIAAFTGGSHDGVVGFGGGSALDLGKMVAFMAGQTRPVWDFEDVDDWWTRADRSAIRPSVAVPTTAGTGSEVGRASVLTQTDTRRKKIIFHPEVLPRVVICDPSLTVGLPPALTAGTGMDALAHAIEAYSSPHYHPMSQGIALEAMRLVFVNLPRVMADPGDVGARGHMMSAALMGAVGFQKGLGAVHALSHPIGALYDTHHGTTNATLLAPVLRLNRPAIDDRLRQASAYCGLGDGAESLVAAVENLCTTLGMPATLGALGVAQPDRAAIIEGALADPSAGGNPVPLTAQNLNDILDAVI